MQRGYRVSIWNRPIHRTHLSELKKLDQCIPNLYEYHKTCLHLIPRGLNHTLVTEVRLHKQQCCHGGQPDRLPKESSSSMLWNYFGFDTSDADQKVNSEKSILRLLLSKEAALQIPAPETKGVGEEQRWWAAIYHLCFSDIKNNAHADCQQNLRALCSLILNKGEIEIENLFLFVLFCLVFY